MAVIQGGTTNSLAEVDTTQKALRTSIRPVEGLGHFKLSGASGALTGEAANTTVWSFRWGDATKIAVVYSVRVKGVVTTALAGTEWSLGLIKCTGFSASDSAGTALLTAAQNKTRTSQTNSALTDCRIAAATNLTAGTRTKETQPMAHANGWLATAGNFLGNGLETALLGGVSDMHQHPVVLVQNEGLIIDNLVAQSTSVVKLYVTVEWAEIATTGGY